MKTTINKFDYPTAASQNYKLFSLGATKDELSTQEQIMLKKNLEKQRYKQVIEQQRHNQRAKVRMQQERRKEKQKLDNQKKLRQELQNKKKQLIELEKKQNEALQAQKKGFQMALIRQQQEKANQIEKERKEKQNQFHAQNRFISALRRLEEQKDRANKKNKQAMNRRKVAENTEKIQREKAIKYRELIEEKERNVQPEQKISFKDYKQILGRTAFQMNIDYTRTHIHNPQPIIIHENCEQNQAMSRAAEEIEREKEKERNKKENQEQNRRISMQRGQKALDKIRLEQQYNKYRREQESNSIKYNLQRLEAGKKNQYIGVKPSTMAQMEQQRKIRREQEFQKMFFSGKAPQCFSEPATKYNIGQARLGDTQVPVEIIPLSRGNPRSNLADISDGHYSFEEREGIDELTTVKKQEPYEIHEDSCQVIGMNPIEEYENKRISNNYYSGASKQKEDLSYSESEEDST